MSDPVRSHERSRGGRGQATKQRVLDAAIAAIEAHGEAALRVEEVARTAGVSVGTIYRYFANREGLVVAARAAQYAGAHHDDVAAMAAIVDAATTPADLVASLEAVTRAAGDPSRSPLRMRRIEIIGAARARPELAAAVGAEQARITDRLTEVVHVAQDRGLVDADLDARSIALFVQAFTLGQVLAEIDPSQPFDLDAWTALAQRFTAAVAARPGD